MNQVHHRVTPPVQAYYQPTPAKAQNPCRRSNCPLAPKPKSSKGETSKKGDGNVLKLLSKQNKMFKTRIQMTLQPQPNNNTEMLTINVSINPKQPPPDRPHSPPKSLWKWHAQLCGERALVVDPGLDVRHERVDVFGGRHFEGFGPRRCARGVGPEVFVALAGGHCWAGCGGAEFGDGAVEHVDLVEKVDGCAR